MRKLMGLLFGSFWLLQAFSTAGVAAEPGDSLHIHVTGGYIRGVYDPETGLRRFWGVPYARPPLGQLRWRPPQPVQPWTGERPADHFGPRPMQKRIFSDMRFRSDSISEDCLYLNIWTPDHVEKPLPVLVYFYGGGFVAGDASEWRYDGTALAQRGIVVVTVNYRLGIFGFFVHPALVSESPHHAAGNYGLLDQQAALAWVRYNIAAFGGDPARVTIGGESAGSISVFAQMASPLSRNLIAGAIGESGAMVAPTLPAEPLDTLLARGTAFAHRVGAQSLEELRAMPAAQLLEEASKLGIPHFAAAIDGYFFPRDPVEIFRRGEQARVPLLVGWNSAEVGYGSWMGRQAPTPENYRRSLDEAFGARAAEALKLFPGGNRREVLESATALASGRFIVYSTWAWAELHRRTGGHPVFRYLFMRPRPLTHPEKDQGEAAPPRGAGHSVEIEYALGNLRTNPVYPWMPDDYKVSATMLDYFAHFIQTGDPNGGALPHWAGNTPGRPVQVMHIDVESSLHPEAHRDRYLFLGKVYGKGL